MFCLGISAFAYVPMLQDNFAWHSTEGGWGPQEYTYHLEGDSTAAGLDYQIFVGTLVSNPEQVAFTLLVREDIEEKKVYARWDDIETLLYDFDMIVGQTVEIAVQGCPVEMTCTGIGTIPILSGGLRTAWYFDFGFGGEIWIEGIGSSNGPIAPGAYLCIADWDPILNCFYDNNQLRYDNPDDSSNCGFTGINEVIDVDYWSVTSQGGQLKIQPQGLMSYQLIIHNQLGQIIHQSERWGSSNWDATNFAGKHLLITLISSARKETHPIIIQ